MVEATPTPTPTPTGPWYQGNAALDADLIGHIQTKGWKDQDAPTMAINAVKAHREAEKFLGVKATQLVRLPEDPKDEKGWGEVWSKLGAAKDEAELDFKDVKLADGKPLPDSFTGDFKKLALQLHLSKDAAIQVAQYFAKQTDGGKAAETAEYTAQLETDRADLAKNWGANKEANMVVAKNAAAALGVSAADIANLEKVVGYSRVMEMFRNIGTKIGEDKFVTAEGTGSNVMTRDQAVTRKNDLMGDKAWVKRYMDGGVAEKKEMLSLNTIITEAGGEARQKGRVNGFRAA